MFDAMTPANLIAELANGTLLRHVAREMLLDRTDTNPPEGVPMLVCAGATCSTPSLDPVRLAVAARAIEEWRHGVHEPPGANWQRIDGYIRGPEGLGWPSAALQGTNDSKDYRRNGQFAWCGAFAAWCWSVLDPAVRRQFLASCYRLDQWSKGNARRVAPEGLLPGDVAVVGPEGKFAHVTVCIGAPRPLAGVLTIETVEGNATGPGPDGTTYEGVIRRTRPLTAPDARIYRVHFGVRPAAEDMDGR